MQKFGDAICWLYVYYLLSFNTPMHDSRIKVPGFDINFLQNNNSISSIDKYRKKKHQKMMANLTGHNRCRNDSYSIIPVLVWE